MNIRKLIIAATIGMFVASTWVEFAQAEQKGIKHTNVRANASKFPNPKGGSPTNPKPPIGSSGLRISADVSTIRVQNFRAPPRSHTGASSKTIKRN